MTGFQQFQAQRRELTAVARSTIPRGFGIGKLTTRVQVSGYGREGREHCVWWSDELNPFTRDRLLQLLTQLAYSHTYHEDFRFRLVVTSAKWGSELASTDVTAAIDLINTGH